MMWRRSSRDSRPSGASGRHRAGQVHPTTVHRRLWDGPARAQAERLARTWPSWTILYGVGSRRFYALAAWPTPEPLMVEAAMSEELERRMYEAVMTVTTHRETSLTAPPPTALPAPPVSLPPRAGAAAPLPRHLPPCRTTLATPTGGQHDHS